MKSQMSKPIGRRGLKGHISDIVFSVASFLNAVVPVKKQISMCSTPDFADNARALYEYMQTSIDFNTLKGYSIVWHVLNPSAAEKTNHDLGFRHFPVRFVKKNRLKSMFEMFKSEYIISTHGLYRMIKLKDKQVHAFLFHGMLVKKIGFLYENDMMHGVNQNDMYFATSSFFREMLIKCYHADEEDVYITGQPRNDWLFRKLSSSQIRAIHTLGDNIIIYLPTYRHSNNRNASNGEDLNQGNKRFGGSEIEWTRLNNVLQSNGLTMVIKPHPAEHSADYEYLCRLSNIRIISDKWLQDNGLVLYNLLSISKSLITDISSVYIDYLLLDKPICFYFPDFQKYTDSRGYTVDNITDYLPGIMINEFDGIERFINSVDIYGEKRSAIRDIFFKNVDDNSSERVFNVIFHSKLS